MIPPKKIQDELPGLKKSVMAVNAYFKDNYTKFNSFRKFVYETSITEDERGANNLLSRPNLQFNVITAYVSRQCGEFSKQEPGIEITADDDEQIEPELVMAIEGHVRHIIDDAKKANTQYHTYRDSLSGGFSSLRVFTEYENEKSFKQVIKMRKTKFPTLAGWDTLATEPHKGDGNYCFECFPKTKEDFKMDYSDVDIEEIKFTGADSIGGFSWSFNNGNEDVILICRMFKKKKRKVKIVELADGQTLTEKEYKEFIEKWNSSRKIEQAPIVVDKRDTYFTTICQYIFIEDRIIEYKETDYDELPNPFVDGDSIDLYDDARGTIKQLTRPYAINAHGAQQLKNLGGQCLASALEGITQSKFIIKKEALPLEPEFIDAILNPQKGSVLVVNAFKDGNPDQPIPEPIVPVMQQAIPPEISNSIQMADSIIQNELGAFDAALGIDSNHLSGLAMIESATQSNATAMPFLVNYISALNQAAIIMVGLMFKKHKRAMSLPIIDEEGNHKTVKINQPGGLDFKFNPKKLKVKVTAGANFAIQKDKALKQIIAMCSASPIFAQFMNTKGLKILLDNFEVRGAPILKKLADEYMKEMEQEKQQAQQMQGQMMQNNPKMMSEHTKAFNAQVNAALGEEKLKLEKTQIELKKEIAYADRDASLARAHAEEVRANIDLKIATHDMHHRHGKESIETLHKIHTDLTKNKGVNNE